MIANIMDDKKAIQITPREAEVLVLLAQGKSAKLIAAGLNISAETVRKHLKNIYLKTGAHNNIQALNKTKCLITSLATSN